MPTILDFTNAANGLQVSSDLLAAIEDNYKDTEKALAKVMGENVILYGANVSSVPNGGNLDVTVTEGAISYLGEIYVIPTATFINVPNTDVYINFTSVDTNLTFCDTNSYKAYTVKSASYNHGSGTLSLSTLNVTGKYIACGLGNDINEIIDNIEPELNSLDIRVSGLESGFAAITDDRTVSYQLFQWDEIVSSTRYALFPCPASMALLKLKEVSFCTFTSSGVSTKTIPVEVSSTNGVQVYLSTNINGGTTNNVLVSQPNSQTGYGDKLRIKVDPQSVSGTGDLYGLAVTLRFSDV